MLHNEVSCSIEANSASLQCRQFYPKTPIRDDRFDKPIYPFKLGIYGLVVIDAELNPKEPVVNPDSILDHGHGIQGESIYGFSVKPIPAGKLKQATGRHKGSFFYRGVTPGASIMRSITLCTCSGRSSP